MNRMRKILSLKLWVPVLCVGLVILIAQAPLTKKVEIKREIKGYRGTTETVQGINWGSMISAVAVSLGSIATIIRGLVELVALLKRRKVGVLLKGENLDKWLDRVGKKK